MAWGDYKTTDTDYTTAPGSVKVASGKTAASWLSAPVDASNAKDKASGKVTYTVTGGSIVVKSRSSANGTTGWSKWYTALGDGTLTHPANSFAQLTVLLNPATPELQDMTLFFDGSPAATSLITGLTPSGNYFFDTLLDSTLIVNGLDIPKKWDGVNPAADLGGSPPRGEYIAVHKNRVFMLVKSRLHFSDVLNLDSWPVLNFIDISPNDGDTGTGLAKNSDYLTITKQRSIHILTGDSTDNFSVRRLQATTGCIAPRSLCLVNEVLSFVSDDGVYFSDFAQVHLMSERLRKTWDGLNLRRLNQVASVFYKHKLYIAVPSVNSLVNDTILIYDTIRQAWNVIPTGAWNPSCWTLFRETGKEICLFGFSTKGQVREIEKGYSDDGAGIPFEWESKHFDFGIPERLKRFRKVYLEVVPDATTPVTLNISFIVDNGAASSPIPVTVPASTTGAVQTIRLLPSQVGVVQGHSLGFKITQSTPNAAVGILSVMVEYFVKGARPTI